MHGAAIQIQRALHVQGFNSILTLNIQKVLRRQRYFIHTLNTQTIALQTCIR